MGTVSEKDVSSQALRKEERLPTLNSAKLANVEAPCSAIDRLGKETLCSLAAKKKKKTISDIDQSQITVKKLEDIQLGEDHDGTDSKGESDLGESGDDLGV